MAASHRLQLALNCTVQLFGRWSVSAIINDPALDGPRDLDVVELWAGVGAVAAAASARGLEARTFDICHGPDEDITTSSGFVKAVRLVLQLKKNGLLAMAPVCSSFVFPPSSVTRRNKDNFAGNPLVQCVRDGNLMANIAVLLLSVAVARGATAFIENPAGSMIFSYLGTNLSRLSWLSTGYADRCAYVTKKMKLAQSWKKTFKFVATDKWIVKAMRRCRCSESTRHAPLMDRDEAGNVNGRPLDLAKSGSYPPELGRALVAAWQAWRAQLEMPLQLSSCPSSTAPAIQKLTRKKPRAQEQDDDWAVVEDKENAPVSKRTRKIKQAASGVERDDDFWHPLEEQCSSPAVRQIVCSDSDFLV